MKLKILLVFLLLSLVDRAKPSDNADEGSSRNQQNAARTSGIPRELTYRFPFLTLGRVRMPRSFLRDLERRSMQPPPPNGVSSEQEQQSERIPIRAVRTEPSSPIPIPLTDRPRFSFSSVELSSRIFNSTSTNATTSGSVPIETTSSIFAMSDEASTSDGKEDPPPSAESSDDHEEKAKNSEGDECPDVPPETEAEDHTPLWHQYTFQTGSHNREELQILEVVAEKDLYLDRPIIEWTSCKNHAVGRGIQGFTTVVSLPNGIFYKHYDGSYECMAMFDWWNEGNEHEDVGLLATLEATVDWYRINENNDLEKMWQWNLFAPIEQIAIYRMDQKWKVALIYRQADGNSALSIYGADLWKDYWFEEKLEGYGTITVINDGRFLATLDQYHTKVIVYRYDYALRRYVLLQEILSAEIKSMSAFVVGANSFLAIGGESPAIYEIRADQFVQKNIRDYNLNHVEFYLPVSLGYYRNDVALLFQHKLDHSTHSSSTIEALQWDGSEFFLLEHSPCRSHDTEMYGFSCLMDFEEEKGIQGATTLRTLDDVVHILVGSDETMHPIMFNVKTQLVDLPDPIDQDWQNILDLQKNLDQRIFDQFKTMETANKILDPRFNPMEGFGADNWGIREIRAPSVRTDGNFLDLVAEGGHAQTAGQDWRNVDVSLDVDAFFARIKSNHDRIKRVVEALKDVVLKKNGLPNTLDRLEINGNIIVYGDIQVKEAQIQNLNGLNVDDVLKYAVKKDDSGKDLVIDGEVCVENLRIDNINAEFLNGVDIVRKPGEDPVVLDGDFNIKSHVHIFKDVTLVNGTINGIDLARDVITSSNEIPTDANANFLTFDSISVAGTLVADHDVNGYDFTNKGFSKLMEEKRLIESENSQRLEEMTLESLTVDENFVFENINGRSWLDFADRLVSTDRNEHFHDLNVDGTIFVNDSFEMKSLNGQAFPEGYVRIDENVEITTPITGRKVFANGLQAGEVDCEVSINGIFPEDLVTLSTEQNLDNFTFVDLTVTENMNVRGDITGRELDAFLFNPKLTETKQIQSDVIFRNLTIIGDITVSGRINGSDLEEAFEGVVIKSDEFVEIDSFKSFEGTLTMTEGANVRSGFLNDRRFVDFLTVDTEQSVSNNILNGEISFDDLIVDGSFDGVDVDDLMTNSVKTVGDQAIMSNLIFDMPLEYAEDPVPLEASRLEVKRSCNGWPIEELVFDEQESLILNSPSFAEISVDRLTVRGNISNLNDRLQHFDSVRLSKSRENRVTAPYRVSSCSVDGIEFKAINGLSEYEIRDFATKAQNLYQHVTNGEVEVNELHVAGSLDVSMINNVDIRRLAEDAVWINGENEISGRLTFRDKLHAKNPRVDGNVNGFFWEKFANDIATTEEEPLVLTGTKTYQNGVDILGSLTTDFINELNVSNILTFNEDQEITGNVYVDGRLYVSGDLDAPKLLKDLSTTRVVHSEDQIEIYDDVTFSMDDVFIKDLDVFGTINDVYSLQSTFDDVNVYNTTIVFTNKVTFGGDLYVTDTYNSINVNELWQNLVLLEDNVTVNSKIVFKQPLTVEGALIVKGNLWVDSLKGCSVEEWKQNAIFLNEPQRISGVKHFEDLTIKGNLSTSRINDRDFSSFVTLYSDRTGYGDLKFNTLVVDGGIQVLDKINQIDIVEQYRNTMMNDEDQTISTPINVQGNIVVTDKAYIRKINGKNMNDVVDLDLPRDLFSDYIFLGNVTFENTLNAEYISNINFNTWLNNAVLKNSARGQFIIGQWNVQGHLVLEGGLRGNGTLDGLKDTDLIAATTINKTLIENSRTRLQGICKSLQKSSIPLYRTDCPGELVQEIDRAFVAHYFLHRGKEYMVTNEPGNCFGFVWLWEEGAFSKINQLLLGCPKEWHSLLMEESDDAVLISIDDGSCQCSSARTTVWRFDGITLWLIEMLPPVSSIHVDTRPGIFYGRSGNAIVKFAIQKMGSNLGVIRSDITTSDDLRLFSTDYSIILTNEKILLKYEDTSNTLGEIFFDNQYLASADEMINFKAGKRNKELTAVIWKNRSIIVYENAFLGKVFQKIELAKPSHVAVIRLNEIKTLLASVEGRYIQLYQYRGYEGFSSSYLLEVDDDIKKIQTIGGKDFDSHILVVSNAKTSLFRLVCKDASQFVCPYL